MQRRPVPIHNLRPNETVWTPPAVAFIDTETRWHDEGLDEIHQLRLWVACQVDRRHQRKARGPVVWGHGDTAEGFASWLNKMTVGRPCLWVYAHNLNFDLVTTRLPQTMARLGWSVSDFSVRNQAPWLRLGRGRYTITVCDSWSWLPQSLESVASLMGGHKADLPENDGSDDDWWHRCAGDVDLLARAVLSLMDWWDHGRLGRWSISGAGSGWNAMRHVPSTQRHVIDPNPELVAQDRQAVRGGRKDAQVVKSDTGGPWVELDLVAAYPSVALHLPLPIKRGWRFDTLDVDSQWIGSRFYAPVAECVVTTDRPRYPVRHDGVTWFPTGTFCTTLAGPEMAAAAASGSLVSIGPGQIHKLGYALRPWAAWALDPSHNGERDVPAVARLATKSWGRSVLGKFAARSHTTEPMPGPAGIEWSITDGWDRRVGRRGADVTMAGRRFWVTYDGDTENCYPAVLAWVESEVRVRLGAVLDALGAAWWTCDTDGLIVDLRAVGEDTWRPLAILGHQPLDVLGVAQGLCDVLAPLVAPLVLRPKRVFESLSVLGPQHLTAGAEMRYAGVSKHANTTPSGNFVVRDWPGLKWQIEHSRPGLYTRPSRELHFEAPTVHRWVASGGEALPIQMMMDDRGRNQIVPWAETGHAEQGWELAPVQYPRLERLR